MRKLLLIVIMAGSIYGQTKPQSEEAKQLALSDEQIALMKNPSNLQTEVYEAEDDEHKVRVYRLLLNVPAKGARKADWVAINYRLQVTYHVATSQRREAQMEAVVLGTDAMEATTIDREHCEAEWNILGKPTSITLRYFAGSKLVASQDLLAIDATQANKIIDRMVKLEEWARLKSGN
jgi:hypothetical protein